MRTFEQQLGGAVALTVVLLGSAACGNTTINKSHDADSTTMRDSATGEMHIIDTDPICGGTSVFDVSPGGDGVLYFNEGECATNNGPGDPSTLIYENVNCIDGKVTADASKPGTTRRITLAAAKSVTFCSEDSFRPKLSVSNLASQLHDSERTPRAVNPAEGSSEMPDALPDPSSEPSTKPICEMVVRQFFGDKQAVQRKIKIWERKHPGCELQIANLNKQYDNLPFDPADDPSDIQPQ